MSMKTNTEAMDNLDDIIDKYAIDVEYWENWYSEYGGCQCNTPNARPPCTFCEAYPFDEDPLELYNKKEK